MSEEMTELQSVMGASAILFLKKKLVKEIRLLQFCKDQEFVFIKSLLSLNSRALALLILQKQTLQMLFACKFALAVVTIATILPVGLSLWPFLGSFSVRASLAQTRVS
jgi:hypothetical protein